MHLIDNLQYANWSEKIFKQMREGGVDAVHVTIAYHEMFREAVANIKQWNRWFERYPDLIFHGTTGEDVRRAKCEGKTAIFFGFQNPSPIEDDIGLIEICYMLGVRFMQLTYNNQSLLATGCYEEEDSGVTRMGKQVIKEMNRVGMIIDMSHSSERSTLDAIEISQRPIAITHANPYFWHPAKRNKSDAILHALGQSGGILGFSLYPHHLKNKSDCSLESFCEMIARTADLMGIDNIGIGSDLCQDQPDSIVEWMRVGRWTKDMDYGEGSAKNAGFPAMPSWFKDNRHFDAIAKGLEKKGFLQKEISAVMGENWLRFYDENFGHKHLKDF
ncbi:dipeptidase [Candidatus Puniceispirillum sp.]|nr:dipeptidase [Candidatus Puniceispirillum sp.]